MKQRPRSYHHGDLKAAIMDAALALVRTKGPRGFTLNQASRIAGVSVSAPYNHFKDKEALIVEIMHLGNRTLLAELQAASASATSAREGLLEVFLAYIAFAKHHADLFSVMFHSGIDKTQYPEIHIAAAEALAVATDLAVRIESSTAEAEQLAVAVWTMAHGFASLTREGAFSNVETTGVGSTPEAFARRLIG